MSNSSSQSEKKWGLTQRQWISIAVIVIALLVYFFVPSVNNWVNSSLAIISNEGIDGVIEFIQGYKGLAAVVSSALMVLASILAPIPQFLITLSNAAIFGWWQGALLSWSSSMVGAAVCFYIARGLGRDVVIRFTGERALDSLDGFFEKYGRHTIMVARLLPFMSFDLVSYAAGLTSMSFWSFFWATGLGQAPATIVYSYVGSQFDGGAKGLFYGLTGLFALSVIIWVIRDIWKRRNKNIKIED